MQQDHEGCTNANGKRASSLWLTAPDTVALVNELARLGADRAIVMSLLGCETGRHRIRRMLDAAAVDWRGGDRAVSSPAWYLEDPQRMIEATMIVLGYLNLRDRLREAGGRCEDPLGRTRLHVEAYRFYLALKHVAPDSAAIPFKRAVMLIKLFRNSVFILRRCHACGVEYLDAAEQVDRGICRSCEIGRDIFCQSCGATVRNTSRHTGRLSRHQICNACST